jgi:dipeptidyl aminopeptidase/acylaminoacyl peptidase
MNSSRHTFWTRLMAVNLILAIVLILILWTYNRPTDESGEILLVTAPPVQPTSTGFNIKALTTTPPVAPPTVSALFTVQTACRSAYRLALDHWDQDSEPVFSPDGRRMAQTSNDIPAQVSRLRLANSDGSDDVWLEPQRDGGYVGTLLPPTWSPDGRLIALQEMRLSHPGGAILHVVSRDGTEILRLARYYGYYDQIAWSTDSRFIAFTSGIVYGAGSSGRLGDYQVYIAATDGVTPVYLLGRGCDPSAVYTSVH